MASPAWSAWLSSRLSRLKETNLLRTLLPVDPLPSHPHSLLLPSSPLLPTPTTAASPAPVVVFAANDYLGLSCDLEVRQAACEAAAAHGCGPRASPLVCGHTSAHRALETELAALKGSEEAALFPSGFSANLAVLGAFGSSPDVAIFSDAWNHASIVDGARLAARGGAELHVYRHSDLSHLNTLLSSCAKPRKLVISDSLFSMDGDFADCIGLSALCRTHQALLCLDEAHATLVCGDRGGGVAEAQGVEGGVDISVGTLSKAFGAHGGFVCCSSEMKQVLTSTGRSGIFSTALPMPIVAAARAALRLATPERRARLWSNLDTFKLATGVQVQSPIVPLIIGSEQMALEASAELLRRGLF
ncbi:MAG: hypothetical protein SGPRY_013958, partial [Prymnesium sp.]